MIGDFSLANYFRERNGVNKVSILAHPVFWAVLGVKIFALFLFGSSVLTEHYIPFVQYFLYHPLANPYDWAMAGDIVFPFPALMLFVLAASKLLFGFIGSDLFIFRIPLLLADLVIFIVLARWLKHKQEKVLWYYWCSPIIFAICYMAGFLDIVAIAFLFTFLYFLFKEKYLIAFALLGLALATKTGLMILLPFILVYLLKERVRPLVAFALVPLSCSLYVLWNFGYILTPAFWHTSLSSSQMFISSINIDFGAVVLYGAPLVYCGLLVRSITFHRLNRDLFLMFLGFALGIVTLIVVPEAGWYSWIIPFFVYFFVKEDGAGNYPFVLLNIFYFAYFLSVPDSALLEALSLTSLAAASDGTWASAAFTLLQGTLLLNIVWIYRLGIQRGVKHKISYKPYLVGIAGDSASGKSTVAGLIVKMLGEQNALEVAGDDMHKWERGDRHWSEVTHLNPAANKLHDDMEHMSRLKRNESVVRQFYDHAVGRFTVAERVRPKKVIVFQGLHTLYLNRARDLLDLKIFLSPHEDLRRRWKVERDGQERGHAPAAVLKQLDERSADAEKYISEQRKYADIVILVSKSNGREVLEIECDNSIDIYPFTDAFKSTCAVTVEHTDVCHRLFFDGQISAAAIDEFVYQVVPDVWELNRAPQWDDGVKGVMQAFIAYALFYKAKRAHDTF